jgi:hypothetical protein
LWRGFVCTGFAWRGFVGTGFAWTGFAGSFAAALAALAAAAALPLAVFGGEGQPGHVLAVVHEHAPRVLERDLDLAVRHHLGDEALAELGVRDDGVLGVALAKLVGFRVLLAVLREELLPRVFLEHRALLRRDGLRDVVLDVTAWFSERVHVAAGIALDAANFVLVFRNDDVRSIALTFRAICLDVGADLVDLVLEHKVHGSASVRLSATNTRGIGLQE